MVEKIPVSHLAYFANLRVHVGYLIMHEHRQGHSTGQLGCATQLKDL
jgi:hypothetical protein